MLIYSYCRLLYYSRDVSSGIFGHTSSKTRPMDYSFRIFVSFQFHLFNLKCIEVPKCIKRGLSNHIEIFGFLILHFGAFGTCGNLLYTNCGYFALLLGFSHSFVGTWRHFVAPSRCVLSSNTYLIILCHYLQCSAIRKYRNSTHQILYKLVPSIVYLKFMFYCNSWLNVSIHWHVLVHCSNG